MNEGYDRKEEYVWSMKSQNTQIAKLLQRVAFVYGVKNTILIKKQDNIVGNTQNNGFLIYVTFEKRDVSA